MNSGGRRTSVMGGSLLLGASTLLQLGSSLVVGILVARTLGPAGKGEFALLQQFPAAAALMLGLGFGAANAYFVGRRTHAVRDVVSDSLAFAFVASALGVPITVLLMREFVPALSDVPVSTLALASAALLATIATGALSGVLTGLGRLRGAALSQVLSSVTALGLVTAWWLGGSLTLPNVVFASVAGALVAFAVSLVATGAGGFSAPSISRVRERWGYARTSYVTTLTGYLEMRQDILLLGILSSASGVGIYSVGASFAELLWFAPHVTAAPLMARAYEEDVAQGAALTSRLARLTLAAMIAIALALVLVLRPLIVVVFGTEFAPAASVFAVLAPGIVAAGLSGQLSSFLSTHGRLFPGVATLGLALNLVLNIATIPFFGYWGAAASTTVSYTVGAVLIVRAYLAETEQRASDVLLARPSDIAFAAAALRALRDRD